MSRMSLIRATGIDGEWLARLYWTTAGTLDLVTFWWIIVAVSIDGTPDCPLSGIVTISFMFGAAKSLFVTYALRRWLTLHWLKCCVPRPQKYEVSGILTFFLGVLQGIAFLFFVTTTDCGLATASRTASLLAMWGAFASLISMILVKGARSWCMRREVFTGVTAHD